MSNDPAKDILTSTFDLDDGGRALAWDMFHDAKDASELSRRLQSVAIPDDTKRRLVDAKSGNAVQHLADNLTGFSNIDPKLLDLGEQHPHVFATLLSQKK